MTSRTASSDSTASCVGLTTSQAPAHPLWRPGENPTVDLVIFRQLNEQSPVEVLIIRRSDTSPACPGMLANPGGFIDSLTPRGQPFEAAETPRQAALRELKEETGLSMAELDSLIQDIGRYGGLERDPRSTPEAYIVSTAFAVLLTGARAAWGDDTVGGSDATHSGWLAVERLKDETLAFDHGRIIEDAAKALGVALPGSLRSWVDEQQRPSPKSPKV